MNLSPDKIALAVLYYLYSEDEPAGDPDGIAKAIKNGFSPGMVSASLEKLCNLGLVVWTGPMPMIAGQAMISGLDWCGITDQGHDFTFQLVRQPKSFVGRLHSEGFAWLQTSAAQKAKLSFDLTKHGMYKKKVELEEKQKKPLNRLATFFGVSIFLLNVLIALAALATIGGFAILLSDKGWL